MIRLPFNKLTTWQQAAFAAALIERMLPNYSMFSQATQFGDIEVLRNQLNLVWQRLDKSQKVKINYDVQLEKLESNIPNPEHFDFFGVFPALDACMAITALLQFLQDQDIESINQVSRLSTNSVAGYVELLLADELEQAGGNLDEITEEMLKAHPLSEWESAMQNELFDALKQAPENAKTISNIQTIAMEQGLSNLGIEVAASR